MVKIDSLNASHITTCGGRRLSIHKVDGSTRSTSLYISQGHFSQGHGDVFRRKKHLSDRLLSRDVGEGGKKGSIVRKAKGKTKWPNKEGLVRYSVLNIGGATDTHSGVC